MNQFEPILSYLKDEKVVADHSDVKVYSKSYEKYETTKLLMVKDSETKYILAVGEGNLFEELSGKTLEGYGKVCPLSHENRLVLNKYFPYTLPKAFGTEVATMGLGDRLGIASPGHIETLRNRNAKPILAQQSIRELTLTNRSMNDILDAAAFAVFQEGYKDGYGADGDHIKIDQDIEYALSLGISFLTLDCSDHIRNDVTRATDAQISTDFNNLPLETQEHFNSYFLNQSFEVNGLEITYDERSVMKNVLLYGDALNYTEHVFKTFIKPSNRDIDFELSIDETETVTSPDEHFFVASELKRRGVLVNSLAPRFCGEFQKGIDYIGDLDLFEKELRKHALIAEHFGYKLSIHSGSDKFSVFPIIGKYTKGILHVKTAGTNWLEAVRVVAKTNPDLYRRMHKYADEHFEEALQYYHITPDLSTIPSLNDTSDEDLPSYMDNDAARQLIHVTYGILLTAKDENNNFLFKNEFYRTLNENEESYKNALINHIGKHADLLGL